MKANNRDEYIKLQNWGETILTFMSAIPDTSMVLDETGNWVEIETPNFMEELIDIFNQCVERGNFVQLRMLVGDIKEWALGMKQKDIIKLNRILMDKFGEDLTSSIAKRMAGVLKRGKIRNDEEFVRVNEWIDHLLYDKDNPNAEQQIQQFNQMLLEYQEKAARKLKKSK